MRSVTGAPARLDSRPSPLIHTLAHRWHRGAASIGRSLYRDAAPPSLYGGRRVALLATLLIAGAAISLARTSPAHWDVLWAEDGPVFLRAAYVLGPEVIFEPYAGYLHVAPRLLAEIAALFPLSVAPAVVTLLAALSLSVVACACFVFVETVVLHPAPRIAAWIGVVAAPTGTGEVLNSIANLHWFLLIGGFCAVLARPRPGAALWVAQVSVLSLAVLSDALGLLLVPLVVIRALLRGGRADWIMVIMVGIAGLIQMVGTTAGAIVMGERNTSGQLPTLGELLDVYAFRVVAPTLIGVAGTERIPGRLEVLVPLLATCLLTAILVGAATRVRWNRGHVLAYAMASMAITAVVYSLQWQWLGAPRELWIGERYAVVPTVLLGLALIVAAGSLIEKVGTRSVARGLGVLVLLWIVILAAIDFRSGDRRVSEEPWATVVSAASIACADGAASVALPIAPEGWALELSCAVIGTTDLR